MVETEKSFLQDLMKQVSKAQNILIDVELEAVFDMYEKLDELEEMIKSRIKELSAE